MFEMKKKMSPAAQKAKLAALKGAHKVASDMMKDDLSGLKKVTVASDSKSGLKEGLEKAEEMLGEKDCSSCPGCPECEGEQDSEDSEMGESEGKEADAYEDDQDAAEPMDMDELEKKIQELMKLKEKLQK
jgi:hypothetical protein